MRPRWPRSLPSGAGPTPTTPPASVTSWSGSLLGSWSARSLNQPQDITTNGTDIWIVDNASDRVYRYADAAKRRSGSQSPTDSFALDCQDGHPSGIVTDGATIWVTDDFNHKNNVFVYSICGSRLGAWRLDAANDDPSGITLNPSGGTDLWIVDRHDALVYHYADATTRRKGSQIATDSFTLICRDQHPEGIADPPPIFAHSGEGATLFLHNNVTVPDKVTLDVGSGAAGDIVWVDDSLIGGAFPFDPSATALGAVMAEWAGGKAGYSTRVGHDVGLNANVFVNEITIPDDGREDRLTGFVGRAWFFTHPNGEIQDIVTDLLLNKIVPGAVATDARISWPCCRALHHRRCRPAMLVDDELLRAIRTESAEAIKYWFGVSTCTVWSWRKAFGISQWGTEGSRRLHQALSETGAAVLRDKPLSSEQVEQRRRRAIKLNLGRSGRLRCRPGGTGARADPCCPR
jgi:hypothetical protein